MKGKIYSTLVKHILLMILVLSTGTSLCARTIGIEEAQKIAYKLKLNEVTQEVYDIEGVVNGTCNAMQDSLLLHLDLWQGENMLFVYRFSSFDSLAFTSRQTLQWGDTIVIRTRLENFKDSPCSYYGYLLSVRKYVNPTAELIRITKDKEWKLLLETKRSEKRAIQFWVVTIMLVLMILLLAGCLLYIYHRSLHDPLTGLYNRPAGVAIMKNKLRFNRQGYYCIINIDNFKQINDQYGHQEGDRCLIKLAALIKAHFATFTYRVYGDEFAVYVEGVNQDEIHLMIEDFYGKVQDIHLKTNYDYQVSVRTGIAYYYGEGSFDQLHHRAEMQM